MRGREVGGMSWAFVLRFLVVSFFIKWKVDGHLGAGFVVGVVGDGDGSLMGLHDVVNEAEANSRASDFSVAVAAVEALEDFGAVGFGDAGASVGDDELSSR